VNGLGEAAAPARSVFCGSQSHSRDGRSPCRDSPLTHGVGRLAGSVGHIVFAATMIVLGMLGLIGGHYGVVWQALPRGAPAREVLLDLCAIITIAGGAGLLWRRTVAARVLFAYFLFWLLVVRVPGLFHSLGVDVYWQPAGTR
jgi:hypothetical protein